MLLKKTRSGFGSRVSELNPDFVMPKRPGSPLEPENTRKGSRFFAERESTPENGNLPVHEAETNPKDRTQAEVIAEGPSAAPLILDSGDKKEQDIGLAQLLSLEELTTSEEITTRFHVIAQELFTNYRIHIQPGDKKLKRDSVATALVGTREQPSYIELQPMEMEFYLISPGVHEDPYCHGSLEQTYSGCWYFHRSPRRTESSTHTPSVGGGYRGGSRKGLDITLGSAVQSASEVQSSVSASEKPRGGILLRSVRVISTGAVISGPSLLVDFILQTCGVEDIKTLVAEKWKGDTSAFQSSIPGSPIPQLSFVRSSSGEPSTGKSVTYYTTPRIGLDLGHHTAKPEATNPRVMFVQRPYRFLVEPHLLKVNGRPQMFVGLLHHTEEKLGIVSCPYSQMDKSKILQHMASLGGFSASTANTYLQHYENGMKGASSKVKSFCGMQGVTQSAEKLLQMFGALRASSPAV